MRLVRILKHLVLPHWLVRRDFPPRTLDAIAAAITESERHHAGELRFVVEADLPLHALWQDVSPRMRASDVFAQLRVWDTDHNCGVLIYVQWIDHAVEILADRGISARVPPAEWEAICRKLEAAFRRGEYHAGALAAIARVDALLREHFPASGRTRNELPNHPVLL